MKNVVFSLLMLGSHLSADETAVPKAELRCKHLDFESVKAICGESQQAMVYGFARCRYVDVAMILQNAEESPIKKVFDCALGGIDTDGRPTAEIEFLTTIEGRVITQIPFLPLDRHPQLISRPSKSGMTNLVFENYKRVKEGLPIIPCIFCIDIDDNSIPFSVENVTNNDNPAGDQSIALKELRRGYKLIHEFDNETINSVAKETFKFVKLAKVSEDSYRLELVKAPWDYEEWDALWRARKAKPKSLERLELEGYESNWREELRRAISAYHEQLENIPVKE